MILFGLILSCSLDTAKERAYETLETRPLPAPRLLRRISLDLLGVLPSKEALNEVESNPNAVSEWAKIWLSDPRIEDRMVHLLNEKWHTRIDDSPVIFYEEYLNYAGNPENEYAVERAIMEEPLRIMTNVLLHNEPWQNIVMADWTMANEILDPIWPITYSGPTGWERVSWTDERPAAGVLSSTGLWRRYYSTVSNMNRLRAASISKLLLCEDYTTRQITFSELEISEESLENAIQTNPYCLGCHASLDPIAASLFGFYALRPENIDEVDYYHPEREAMAESALGVSPAWFGDPLNGLNELGQHIAEDPRFIRCTVETWSTLLWRRPIESQDFEQIEALRQDFVKNEYRPHELVLSIIDTPTYQAGSTIPEASDRTIDNEATFRLMMPDQYSSVLKELTGFKWMYQGFDQMDNDTYGHRILSGGVDGTYVLEPQKTPTISQILVVQRLSEAAAGFVVQRELIDGEGEQLIFKAVSLQTQSNEDQFTELLLDLHWRLYGIRAADKWVSEIKLMWDIINSESGPDEAWKALLSAMFQDPMMMGY